MSSDIKNPLFSTIRRVENGWILGEQRREFCGNGVEFVFPTAKGLADFIAKNFKQPVATTETK